MSTTKKHGGRRKGAGRKSAFLPLHAKKLRSTEKEWEEFLSYLTGDATIDFEILLQALMEWRNSGGVHVSEIDGDGTANKARTRRREVWRKIEVLRGSGVP